jgi:hypothetical protein
MYRIKSRECAVSTAAFARVFSAALMAAALLTAQVLAAPDDDSALVASRDQVTISDDVGDEAAPAHDATNLSSPFSMTPGPLAGAPTVMLLPGPFAAAPARAQSIEQASVLPQRE